MSRVSLKDLKDLIGETATRWNDHNAPRLGAALAYYTLLSVAPLLVLIVAICGLIFNRNTAEQKLLQQAAVMTGRGGGDMLKSLLNNAHRPAAGIIATVIATLTLLFGASGVFVELRDSLDTIWDVPAPKSAGWWELVWQRIFAIGMIVGLGVLLTLSLAVSAAFAVVQKFFTGFIPLHAAIIGEVVNLLISIVAVSVLFAVLFKFVPAARIEWRYVVIGAVVTGVLFTIGKSLLSVYLTTAGVGSTYGAAGSLVAFVVWVYYSAQIFLFGAIFTRAYADRFGKVARENLALKDAVAQRRQQSAGA